MALESNIILITNQSRVMDILKPKLVLLRGIDNILSSTYAEALVEIEKIVPDLVLIHCSQEKEDGLKLIKSVKTGEKTKKASIILILDEYDQDFILSAYDEDITDYLLLNADDAEILMRTIWALKKNVLVKTTTKQQDLLENLGIINKKTGFYSHEYCEKIFENEFKTLKETKDDAILMLISASEDSKTKLNPAQLASAIRVSTRNSDVTVHGDSNKFYILLPETNLKGAFCVWDKIKQKLGEEYTINAGVSFVGEKTFEELKKELLNAIVEAVSTKQELIIVEEQPETCASGDWLEKINCKQKNFKLFKQAFTKKLEKVITPVFFQMQKLYEEKLFQTQIEQYSNSALSLFSLKKDNRISELKITYPGFSKINVDIVHQGLDSPENKRISLDLTELDERKLTKILESFISEFKSVE